MSLRKPAIPVVRSGNASVDDFAASVKESLDVMTGQSKQFPKLNPLGATATLADVIAAYNALLAKVQGS
jgi:hypothetical protein